MDSPASARHPWKFFRSGGLDQVALETGADLLALGQLDQELWVALSCPVKGLELDEKTLALIDTDGDSRIGVPEIIGAINWAASRLNDVGCILQGAESLPLAAINAATPEGKIVVAAVQQLLAAAGRKEAGAITVGDAETRSKLLAEGAINGDGILLPEASDDPAVQAVIKEIMACCGGTKRAGGAVGVKAEAIESFFTAMAAYVAWTSRSGGNDIAVLGEATDAACAAIKAVRAKVDDFFARCRLADYDGRAVSALNRTEADYLAVAAAALKSDVVEVSDFPLALIEAGKALPLCQGVNPAWAGAVAVLHERVVTPIFGAGKTSLTAAEWAELNRRFAPYETWLGEHAGNPVEQLGMARSKEILASGLRAKLDALVAQDTAHEAAYKAIGDVERLARYHRDLRALLHNFVNFADFYSHSRYAAFQAGTLYLDSRSTELCIRVDGVNPLAAMSKAYIAYCTCTRAGSGAKMTIAACFTQGDGDYLFVGRNGVFYDRKGNLWYAVITSIVDQPISVRQAFWSPYKKFLRMIEEQIAKRAAAADAESTAKLGAAAGTVANAEKAKPEPKKFDLALITGIGVAVGSIGTFVAAVFTKFLDIPGWQLPLIVVGLMLVVSLPSMFIAALKLRQRTLGPILEGNGWAINGRVKISIPFGAALTKVATLPPGSRRSLDDPYEDKSGQTARRWTLAVVVLLVLGAAAVWVRYDRIKSGHYFWQSALAAAVPAGAAQTAPATVPGK